MNDSKTILVTGGTGNQGGGVAKKLSAAGFKVKVLTRNTASVKAVDLQKLNIELVKGDLDDAESYRQHLKDVYGVFSVQALEKNSAKEIKQGTMLPTLAKEAGVQHFLYSSVIGANSITGIPHFDSKHTIENHIKSTGLLYTIIRPASFYENFLIPQVKSGILKGKLVQPINGETVQQYIAAADVGIVARKIFEHPEMYMHKTLPLAAEQLSTYEVAEIFSQAMNRKIVYKKLPGLIVKIFMGKNLYKMFKWVDNGNMAEKEVLQSTKESFPGLSDLKTWVQQNFKAT